MSEMSKILRRFTLMGETETEVETAVEGVDPEPVEVTEAETEQGEPDAAAVHEANTVGQ